MNLGQVQVQRGEPRKDEFAVQLRDAARPLFEAKVGAREGRVARTLTWVVRTTSMFCMALNILT